MANIPIIGTVHFLLNRPKLCNANFRCRQLCKRRLCDISDNSKIRKVKLAIKMSR